MIPTVEIHLPCACVSYYSNNCVHPRWDRIIELDYNNKHFVMHYCDNCMHILTPLLYKHSNTSKLLYYIFEESGLFVPQKLISVDSGHALYSKEDNIEYRTLVWYRNNRTGWEDIEELKADDNYDLIHNKSGNSYFAFKHLNSLV